MKSFTLLMLAASYMLGVATLPGFGNTPADYKEIPSESESAQHKKISFLPRDWTKAWSNPPAKLRPLQIVHGIPANQATVDAMKSLKKLGLGGIVCNVAFDNYLESEKNWETLIRAVEACQELGLVVWIYDEHGYPSAAAGGLVLKRNKNFEALALTYDPSNPQPFNLRPAYEHTHASNNFHAARRYPNLIDAEAIRCFLDTTHQAYWLRLRKHFGKTIQAVFTDEPSLMAVNIGPLPENVRKNVRVVDPLDENLKPLPSVPWVKDLPRLYRERYGQDIMTVRRSLFTGNESSDRQVRQQFWALIADLIAERYFGQIQTWAQAHHVASSGHTLWEETPLHHVPLEGDALKVLRRMDIPGLDMLNSDPQAVIYNGWLTAGLPASAALFNGTRKVMTEVSDFSQTMAGQAPASLADMQATAAWQAALGVTEFTLYYSYHNRKPENYRKYCDYVGRLNALLRNARPAPRVLLYYPIYDLWPEYRPVAEKLTLNTQSARTKKLVESFLKLGRQMLKNQISFAIVDHELLSDAKVLQDSIELANLPFDALVIPAEVRLPKPADKIVQKFEAAGGKVFRNQPPGPEIDFKSLADIYSNGALDTPSDRIVIGRFLREGYNIILMVNVSPQPYQGNVTAKKDFHWVRADPDTGKIELVKRNQAGNINVALPPQSAIFLVGSPSNTKN